MGTSKPLRASSLLADAQRQQKHVVVSRKQRIVVADGVQSPKEYTNYTELSLFTDHPQKIKLVETYVNKTKMMPWFCPDGEKTIVGTLAAK